MSFRSTDDTAAAFQSGAGAFYRGAPLENWSDADYAKGWVAAALAQRTEFDERIAGAVARAVKAQGQGHGQASKTRAPTLPPPPPEAPPAPLLALLRDGTLRNLADAAKRLASAFSPGVGGKPLPPFRQRLLAEAEAVADAVLERLDTITTTGLGRAAPRGHRNSGPAPAAEPGKPSGGRAARVTPARRG